MKVEKTEFRLTLTPDEANYIVGLIGLTGIEYDRSVGFDGDEIYQVLHGALTEAGVYRGPVLDWAIGPASEPGR